MVQRSLTSLIKSVQEDLDAVRDEFLKNIAQDLVTSSPIDTGNYVSNHSITTSAGAGGRKNSHGRPKDNGSAATESLSKLEGQIANLPADATTVYISNRTPYANQVEYLGWPNSSKGPYFVFEGVRSRAKVHLQDAVQTVKAR
jgi:hypothetical protein